MANPKWGTKRRCRECGVQFYDLKREKIVCPKCKYPFTVEPKTKMKRPITTPENAAPVEETVEKADGVEISDDADTGTDDADTGTDSDDAGTDSDDAGTDSDDAGTDSDDTGTDSDDTGTDSDDTGTDSDDAGEESKTAFENASELGEDEDDMIEVIDSGRKVDGA